MNRKKILILVLSIIVLILIFIGIGKLIYNHGFKKQQIAIIESIIEENVEVITDRWKNYFKE